MASDMGAAGVSDSVQTALWESQSDAPPETATRHAPDNSRRGVVFVTARTAVASNCSRRESFRHQERREGPDPMTARQPGEGRQGAKVSPETGTMWR